MSRISFAVSFPLIFLALLFAGSLSSCAKDAMPAPSFIHAEDGLLRVNNELNQRFVFFSGAPSRESYLGGVPGRVSDFGLTLTNGRWLIAAVKVEDYMIFKTNAASMPILWSDIILINNSSVTMSIPEIPHVSGRLYFHNKTDGFIQILSDSFKGEHIAYLPPLSSLTYGLPSRDFDLYPVRLDWVTTADQIVCKETYLTNASNLVGLYPGKVYSMTISE